MATLMVNTSVTQAFLERNHFTPMFPLQAEKDTQRETANMERRQASLAMLQAKMDAAKDGSKTARIRTRMARLEKQKRREERRTMLSAEILDFLDGGMVTMALVCMIIFAVTVSINEAVNPDLVLPGYMQFVMTIITLIFVAEVGLRMYALNLGCQEGEYLDFISPSGTGMYNVMDLLVTIIDVASLILEAVVASGGGDTTSENEAFGVATILRSLRFVRLIRVVRLMRNQDQMLLMITTPQMYLMGVVAGFVYLCVAWEWIFAFAGRVLHETESSSGEAISVFVAELPILLFFTYPTMFILVHNISKCRAQEEVVLDTKANDSDIQIHLSAFTRKQLSKPRGVSRQGSGRFTGASLGSAEQDEKIGAPIELAKRSRDAVKVVV
jgi:hypothetical protein